MSMKNYIYITHIQLPTNYENNSTGTGSGNENRNFMLMMIRYGEKNRSYNEVVNLLNTY